MSTVYTPQLSDYIARVRTFIDEPSQSFYSNTEIIYGLNKAQQWVANEITQVNEHYFTNPVATTITVTNNTTGIYSLPTDFNKMVRMEIQSTGEMVPAIDINEKSINNQAIPPLVNTAGYGTGLQFYLIGANWSLSCNSNRYQYDFPVLVRPFGS